MYIGNCLSPDHKKYCIRLSLVGPSYPYHVPAFTTFHPLSIYFKLFASCTQFFLSRLFDSAYLFYLSSSPLFAPSSPLFAPSSSYSLPLPPSSLPLPPSLLPLPPLRSFFTPSFPASFSSLTSSIIFLVTASLAVVCKVLFIN